VTISSTSNLTNIVSAVAGGSFGLALDGTGALWAWGINTNAQLGQGNLTNTDRAVRVKLTSTSTLSNVYTMAAEYYDGFAVVWGGTNSGTVWAWGDQGNGQLGNGSTVAANIEYPVQVKKVGGAPLTGIIQMATGPRHALALDGSGNVWAWGYNQTGNLGDGTTTTSSNAEEITIPLNPNTSVVYVGAGGYDSGTTVDSFSYAIGSDGAVYSWGYDGHGELGNGSTSSSTSKTPTQYSTLPNLSTTTVTYNSSGLNTIVLNGTNVYNYSNDSDGGLQSAFAVTHGGTFYSSVTKGYNAATSTTTGTYGFGTVSVQYASDEGRVDATVTVTNNLPLSGTSSTGFDGYYEDDNTIDEFSTVLFQMLVPGNVPTSGGTDTNLITDQSTSSGGGAPVIPGYFESSGTTPAGAITIDDEMIPNTSGTAPDVKVNLINVSGTSSNADMYTLGADLDDYQDGTQTSPNQPPFFANPIPPGTSVSFRLSIGAEGYGSDPSVSRSDIYSKLVSKYPVDTNGAVNWPTGAGGHSNGAIARVFLTSQSAETYNNPRAWANAVISGTYGTPYFASGNPTTAECEAFRSELLASASNTLAEIQTTGTVTQAILFWDVEGEHFDQPDGSYIGDPRVVMPDVGLTGSYANSFSPNSSQTEGQPLQTSTQVSIAPEMDYSHTGNPNLRTLDEYFKIFTNAGYLIGETLRPDMFLATTPNSTGTSNSDRTNCWQYDPNADSSLSSLPLQHQYVVNLLESKIWFAMDRWGMRVFYVDSNSIYDEPQFRKVVDDFYAKYGKPLLLIPEHGGDSFYSCTAKYRDWGYLDYDPLAYIFEPGDVYEGSGVFYSVSTPSSYLRSYIYPNAFSAVVADEGELGGYSLSTYQAQLKSAVQQGDILLYNGWYYNADMQDVINSY
jgi:hypothetical protein